MTNSKKQQYVITLDEGTTSCRTLIVNQAGAIIAIAQEEFTQHFPNSGWVEHDALEIWDKQKKTLLEALQQADISLADIAALGITNQRETVVMWDKSDGKPVYNAIVWQDSRTSQYCEQLKLANIKLDQKINHKTGLTINPYFSATKIRWILQNVPKAQEVLAQGNLLMGTIDVWLLWNLTKGKVHSTDVSNAARTMLFNINTQTWDDDLLALFDIPKSILPQVHPSGHLFGYVDANILGATLRLPSNIPVAGILGDQQSALFGQLCLTKGDLKCTYGTGGFVLINTGEEPVFSKHGLLTTIAWKIGQQATVYALEGSVFSCGTSIQWLRDGLQIIEQASDCDKLVSAITNHNQEIYAVPAFTGLGAPYWDPSARTLIIGVERGTTRGHIVEAMLSGVAYECNELFTCLAQDMGVDINNIYVDGGAANCNYLMQFQASIANKTLVKPTNLETTAMGVAFMAGLQTQIWKNIEALRAIKKISQEFNPQFNDAKRLALLKKWDQAVRRSFKFKSA